MQYLVTASHAMCAHVGGPKKFGGRWGSPPLGREAWHVNLVVLHQTVRAYLRRPAWKKMTVASRLSRSPKVTGTDMGFNRLPGCKLLANRVQDRFQGP